MFRWRLQGCRLAMAAVLCLGNAGHSPAEAPVKLVRREPGAGQIDLGIAKPQSYDLGTIPEDITALAVTLRWVNDTNTRQEISRVLKSCQCLLVESSPQSAEPGQCIDFKTQVALDATGNTGVGFLVQFKNSKIQPIGFDFTFYRPAAPRPLPAWVDFGVAAAPGTTRRFSILATVDPNLAGLSSLGAVTASDNRVDCKSLGIQQKSWRQPGTMLGSTKYEAVLEVTIVSGADPDRPLAGDLKVPLLFNGEPTVVRVPLRGNLRSDIVVRPSRVVILVRRTDLQPITHRLLVYSHKPCSDANAVWCASLDGRVRAEFQRSAKLESGKLWGTILATVDPGGGRSFDAQIVLSIKQEDSQTEVHVPVLVRVLAECSPPGR